MPITHTDHAGRGQIPALSALSSAPELRLARLQTNLQFPLTALQRCAPSRCRPASHAYVTHMLIADTSGLPHHAPRHRPLRALSIHGAPQQPQAAPGPGMCNSSQGAPPAAITRSRRGARRGNTRTVFPAAVACAPVTLELCPAGQQLYPKVHTSPRGRLFALLAAAPVGRYS